MANIAQHEEGGVDLKKKTKLGEPGALATIQTLSLGDFVRQSAIGIADAVGANNEQCLRSHTARSGKITALSVFADVPVHVLDDGRVIVVPTDGEELDLGQHRFSLPLRALVCSLALNRLDLSSNKNSVNNGQDCAEREGGGRPDGPRQARSARDHARDHPGDPARRFCEAFCDRHRRRGRREQ